jgi:hypothetical protein
MMEVFGRALINLLVGFVLALPFAAVPQYALRLALCVASPLAVYMFLLHMAHAGFIWNHAWTLVWALVYVVGALLAAHLRESWQLARRLWSQR